MPPLFRNRTDAGRRLGIALFRYAGHPDTIVLGLPQGGVPVAYEVALALSLPLDVFLVRKLGVPRCEELEIGVVAAGGARILDDEVVRVLGLPHSEIDALEERERLALDERSRFYRGDQPARALHGLTVILVDDGLTAGSTMKAAISLLRTEHPTRIIVAVPVTSIDSRQEIAALADGMVCVCVVTPESFQPVSHWFASFPPTSDEEIRDLLRRSRGELVPVKAAGTALVPSV